MSKVCIGVCAACPVWRTCPPCAHTPTPSPRSGHMKTTPHSTDRPQLPSSDIVFKEVLQKAFKSKRDEPIVEWMSSTFAHASEVWSVDN